MPNPPRLCARAGTSPRGRPRGAASICVGLTGSGPGAFSHSGVPPPRDPSASGVGRSPTVPSRSPSPAAPRSPQVQLLNFSSLKGGSPLPPPAVPLLPLRTRGWGVAARRREGPPRAPGLRPDGGEGRGGRPRRFPRLRTSEAPREAPRAAGGRQGAAAALSRRSRRPWAAQRARERPRRRRARPPALLAAFGLLL